MTPSQSFGVSYPSAKTCLFVTVMLSGVVDGVVVNAIEDQYPDRVELHLVATEEKDFETEKQRLTGLVNTFCDGGPEKASASMHSFLGRLNREEWGVMMFKHLDHHLRQFGA